MTTARSKLRAWLAPAALAIALLGATTAQADPITGTYTTGGATTGTGPWTLTSTDSTFSVLRFIPGTAVTFGALSSVSVNYTSTQGGAGGGAPRIVFVLDGNGDTVEDHFLTAYLGTSPNFNDSVAAFNALSGANILNNDTGRFDLSDATFGGSPFTDYTAALAAAASMTVLRASLILDSFGGADRTLIVEGINLGSASAVPEPATLSLIGLAVFALGATRRRR
ncbi:MAG: PEP-CTERM sorting domain-containing protein [Rubrivivax sp.]|nr:PEP-CTERM sorting domain-containing protein [Rubrivivax sp.]